jgi:transposase-like protein
MADKMTCRTFPTAFKLAAIKRLKAGEAVLPLARELGVFRKILHDWRKAWDLHGPAGLNRKRGPKPGPRKLRPLAKPAAKGNSGELATRERRLPTLNARSDNRRSISIFFTKPCAPWTRPIGKAQSHPPHGSHRSHDFS